LLARADQRQVARPVGAVHPHPGPGQNRQEASVGVAVGVVRADRDEGDPGSARLEETGVGVTAAVMGHLEHVRAQIRSVPDQPGLRLGAQVAGEEDPQPVRRHAGDEREVVGLGRRGRPLRDGREHLHRDAAYGAAVPRHQDDPLATRPSHEPLEGGDPLVGR
jgi:hypothetical protein